MPASGRVKLRCEDCNLARCMTNALLRNGIAVDENSDITIGIDDVEHIMLPNGKTVSSVKEVVGFFK